MTTEEIQNYMNAAAASGSLEVTFKTWEVMEAEYGLNAGGNIMCPSHFISKMRYLAGTVQTLEYAGGGWKCGSWTVSPEMLATVAGRPRTARTPQRPHSYKKVIDGATIGIELELSPAVAYAASEILDSLGLRYDKLHSETHRVWETSTIPASMKDFKTVALMGEFARLGLYTRTQGGSDATAGSLHTHVKLKRSIASRVFSQYWNRTSANLLAFMSNEYLKPRAGLMFRKGGYPILCMEPPGSFPTERHHGPTIANSVGGKRGFELRANENTPLWAYLFLNPTEMEEAPYFTKCAPREVPDAEQVTKLETMRKRVQDAYLPLIPKLAKAVRQPALFKKLMVPYVLNDWEAYEKEMGKLVRTSNSPWAEAIRRLQGVIDFINGYNCDKDCYLDADVESYVMGTPSYNHPVSMVAQRDIFGSFPAHNYHMDIFNLATGNLGATHVCSSYTPEEFAERVSETHVNSRGELEGPYDYRAVYERQHVELSPRYKETFPPTLAPPSWAWGAS